MKFFKTIIFAFSFLLIFGIAVSFSCPITNSPLIGIVGTFKTQGEFLEIGLKNPYYLDNYITDPQKYRSFYDINDYVDIVTTYVTYGNKLDDARTVPTGRQAGFSIPAKIPLSIGDIIIHAPPFHACQYQFYGIFSSEGILKYAVINDGYNDYSFEGLPLVVRPEKSESCTENTQECPVEVNFTINGENNIVKPGFSFSPNNDMFKKITLLEAKQNSNRNIANWDIENQVKYIIEFWHDLY